LLVPGEGERYEAIDLEILKHNTERLSDCVDDAAINDVIATAENPEQAASDLVDTALANGGKDNITVIVVCLEKSKYQNNEPLEKNSFFQKLKKLFKQ